MVVDDHILIRRGICAIIQSVEGWEVCAEAANGVEAIAMAEEARPDIIVMDISMPTVGGIDATTQICKRLPSVEVLVLTMHDSDHLVSQALRAGARGYLLKTESDEKLIDAIEALSRHQPYFSASVSENLLQAYLRTGQVVDPKRLTTRERQIVKLVAEGNTNKAIATILNVSVKTVETHRSSAMHKIGAKSSADIALYAVRNELVQL